MNRVKDYGGDVHIVSPGSASSVVLLISTELSNWNTSDRHGAPFLKDQWSIYPFLLQWNVSTMELEYEKRRLAAWCIIKLLNIVPLHISFNFTVATLVLWHKASWVKIKSGLPSTRALWSFWWPFCSLCIFVFVACFVSYLYPLKYLPSHFQMIFNLIKN